MGFAGAVQPCIKCLAQPGVINARSTAIGAQGDYHAVH